MWGLPPSAPVWDTVAEGITQQLAPALLQGLWPLTWSLHIHHMISLVLSSSKWAPKFISGFRLAGPTLGWAPGSVSPSQFS